MVERKERTLPDFSFWARGVVEANAESGASKPFSGLAVVATPIGNLGDVTLRALHALAVADLVVCEDTRVTGNLLQRYGIKKPLLSYHDHNADERRPEILAQLEAGKAVVLVSDAGTPLISDPGYRLVRACREAGHSVIVLPGASALLTALVAAGLPTDRFFFAGFLPTKTAARQKALMELAKINSTLVFYETPSRLADVFKDMEKVLGGQRQAAVARELTKLFEDVQTGALDALAEQYRDKPAPKGEAVILVGPPVEKDAKDRMADIDSQLKKAMKTMSLRQAVETVAASAGARKSEVYRRALALIRK